MTSEAEYAETLRAAEKELTEAASADDVRRIWRKHFGKLGHRALGRLLVGRSADELLARRAGRD
ncbi:MAG: hypothetical protein OEW93_11780 [Candidatus Bathyarchaeota archaeon]|nr:hypothetical protein [Candidatus Bathyarchaeota archaeon]